MQKKVLTEQALYYGDVAMPKGFGILTEINYQAIFYNHLLLIENFHFQELGIC